MTLNLTPSRLFADTSFYFAVLDPRDLNHHAAKDQAEWIGTRGVKITSTWEVVVETVALLRSRYGFHGTMRFIHKTLPTIRIFSISETDRWESLKLFQKFSADKKISLCDVISYLVVTKYLDHIPCLAFDDDFRALGLTPFKIS